jgi:ADP-L-glycero-D-manno-heptose 6-epimerase
MIIVTGGAGFIGSNLIFGLNAIGRTDILVVDDLRAGEKHRNLNHARFSDIIGKDALLEKLAALGPVEAIFHQGACADTTESDGRYMMRNNYEYSQRLLHFAEERGARLIYASSAAVYGDGQGGFREEAVCEDPLNVYGFSKLVFDNYVRQRSGKHVATGLRYFNVYGPHEQHKGRMASVALHLYRQLQAGERMKLFEGSDGFLRDFIHIDDVVAINLWFLANPVAGIFNCGSGQARPFTDVASTLQTLAGKGALELIPFPADLVAKYQKFTQADLTRLRQAGYDRPMTSLEQGLASYHQVLRGGGYR